MSTEISPLKVPLRVAARKIAKLIRARRSMQFPTYPAAVARRIEQYHDDIRYATLALAIQRLEHDRIPYLFDTFEGFPDRDLDIAVDQRFKDAFPDTASGLETESFALVMLDVDLYLPALEVFRFFYPRMVRGGYFFMHDFNSPESNHGISRAAHEFMVDKPDLLIEIPDFHGSALFRKL